MVRSAGREQEEEREHGAEREQGPGNLNRVIEIQKFSSTRDRFGGVVEAWTGLASGPIWAHLRTPQTPREQFINEAQRILSTRYGIFRIRWVGREVFDERDRVIYDGVIWNIRGIGEVGRRVFTEIKADSNGVTPT